MIDRLSHLDLPNIEIVSIKGGRTIDVYNYFNKHLKDKSYSKIIALVGTNDCASPDASMEDVQGNMTCLVNILKSTCSSVILCSVLPRLNAININNRIDILNAEIAVITQDIDATYMDITSAFMVNSHYNYSLYHDSIHLNSAGMKILAYELGLTPIRQHKWMKTNDTNKKTKDEASVSVTDIQPNRHHTKSNRHQISSASRQNKYSGCYNCGEGNHNQQSCFFQRRLKCSVCLEYGHKAKHHR
jgi:hypothetical protein